jgi:phosphoribosylglycinamide formyltransferase-1
MATGRKRIAVFISGRGSNMLAIARNALEGSLRDCCEIALVFSNNPDAPGLAAAQRLGLPTACIDSRGKRRRAFDREVRELLEPLQIDYIVLAGYMRIISPVLLERYPNRIVNIHPADTALFRGLGAYQWAFEQGLQTTKITVHLVDRGVDTGPVLDQATVDLRGARTLEEVEQRGLAVEHRFYSTVLGRLFRGEIP